MNLGQRLLHTTALVGLLCFLVLGSCIGCATQIRTPLYGRSVEGEKAAALTLLVHCSKMPPDASFIMGSGVVISKTEALTAAHVVDCISDKRDPNDPRKRIRTSLGEVDRLYAFQPDGIGRPMRVAFSTTNSDVARITFADDGEFYGVTKTSIVGVDIGSGVCIVTAFPSRERRCGQVDDITPGLADHLALSMPVEPGNSGSGVYDSKGRLVGVVTRTRNFMNGQSAGGLATALSNREWVTFASLVKP